MADGELRLEPITNSNWRATLHVKTAPGQLTFVADHEPVALVILAKSYVKAGGWDWWPLAIMAAEEVVGVVAIAQRASLCQIFHLVIDQNSQGRGLGKASVRLVLDHIRQELPACKNVTLTVHPNNGAARHIYESSGFQASGECRDSEPVLELTL